MASSSVSQEDVEVDFEISSRRSRIRTARARNINPGPTPTSSRPGEADGGDCGGGGLSDRESGTTGVPSSGVTTSGGGLYPAPPDHDASPKPATRLKEKRMIRANHTNKGKQQRDRRKLREKRRSTGVVHIPSTESTGGSTGEDEELLTMTAETRRNTHYNEHIEKAAMAAAAAAAAAAVVANDKHQGVEQTSSTSTASSNSGYDHKQKKAFTPMRNKSPSDLEADDEDNQDYDSLTMSDSTISLVHHPQHLSNIQQSSHSAHSGSNHQSQRNANGRPPTPTSENLDELLESAREENRRLLCLLEDRDRRISSLETRLTKVTSDLSTARNERLTLRQENNALIRAMSGLTAK